MRRDTKHLLKTASLIAVGLVLARGAQATITLIGDTTITFDNSGLGNNNQIPVNYGSGATPSAPQAGVVIGGSGQGLGTPDVTLTWASTSNGRSVPPTQFQYLQGGPWDAAELFNAGVGKHEDITFAASPFSAVTLSSFNFHPYYNDAETFSYTVSVIDPNTSTVLSSQNVNPLSNATKQGVTLNVAGDIGQSLELDILRTGGTGTAFNMAIDDVIFTESVPEPGTVALLGVGLGGLIVAARRRNRS